MSLNDLWRSMRDRMAPQPSAPATELLPRMRESARLRAVTATSATSATPATFQAGQPSLREVTPFANQVLPEPGPAIAPPPWQNVYPAHHRALVADLAKRGESMDHWEIQDGSDLGVSDAGHTVAFTLHKTAPQPPSASN